MASTNLNPPPGLSADSNPALDNITLRIVILAHGNRAEDDLYLVLSLDTTVGQLKQRIHDSLPHHPAPHLQRLIYQGRPLLDSNVSLRQTLRIDQRPGNTSHVLHLVVRDENPSNLPPDSQSAHHASSTPTPTQPLPGQAHYHLPHLPQGLPNVDHTRIHNQLHNIQHQLHHAQALNRANQARLQAHQFQHQQARIQAQAQGNAPHQNSPSPNGLPLPPHTPHIHLPPNPEAQPGLAATPQVPPETTRVQERIGPNGEHIRTTTTNNGTTSMTFRVTGMNLPNPADRPASAPGSSPTAASDPANRAANPIPSNIQIHAHPPHLPPALPLPPGLQLPTPFSSLMPQPMYNPMLAASSNTNQGQTIAWLLSSPQGPQGIVFAPGHGFFSTLPSITTLPSQLPQQASQPQPTPTPTSTVPNTTTRQPTTTTTGPQRAQLVIGPQDGGPNNQPAPPQPGARPQPAQPAPGPAPARQAQQLRNEENALLNLLLARAWLFLRLYMFVFVLSESGTWRRIIMLASAIIYCLLPRQNPFTEAFQAARRHFHNLIGPPDIPQRQQEVQGHGQAQQQPGQGQRGQTNGQAAPNSAVTRRQRQPPIPTPEETARRLLEQQNRRNPNPILDTLYRIEQGVVLFLASLIPGLGERHIQAREHARRILEEEERRLREERERQEAQADETQQQNIEGQTSGSSRGQRKNDGGPLPADWGTAGAGTANGGSAAASASSSGADRGAGNAEQDVRSRNIGAQ